MNKKVLSTVLAGALAVTAVVGGSLAYFTDKDNKVNTFTVGNVDITLTEPAWDETGSKDAEDAYPGEPLAKDPTVTNAGANPCFVRIKVEGLDQFGADNMIEYRTEYQVGELGEGWELNAEDGYFYYSKVLDLNGKTTPLFDSIVVPTGLTNEDAKEGGYNVTVIAEAVQAQGAKPRWEDVQAMTVEEIAGWFDTCGMNEAASE